MVTMGYWSHQPARKSVNCSAVRRLPSPVRWYLPLSWNSLEATSRPSSTSSPAWYPALPMASRMVSSASSLLRRSGAKPPSSPTAVDRPRPRSTDLSAWKISVPARRLSEKLEKPTGSTMNSCRSTLLSACAPPLTMFIIGTGRTGSAPVEAARCCHSGTFFDMAMACALAIETPSSALAPSRPLFSVPSRSIRRWSSPAWSAASSPVTAWAMVVLTFSTAWRTPLPR